MSEQIAIELRQEKKEAKFTCSACGADRVCNCNAPAIPKAQKAIEALKADPEKSNSAIAAEVGASHTTVQKATKEVEATGNHLPVERTGLDGKTRKIPEKKTEDDEDVVQAICKLRKGAALILTHTKSGAAYFIDGCRVTAGTAERVKEHPGVCAGGDGFFDISQTWRWRP
jgi:hypothetical protein